MARKSKNPKTPEAQIIQSDEVEEDEVNGGASAVEQSSPVEVDPATDGKVRLPINDIPIATSWGEAVSSPAGAEATAIANMGNEQSHDTNTALRATSNTLLQNNGESRKSTGRLNRPYTAKSNPAYQNPVAKQKRMGAETKARQDVYELTSPENSPVKLRVQEQQKPQFSPRRSERKKGAANTEQAEVEANIGAPAPVETQNERSSPRKSRRQQGLSEETVGAATSPKAAKQQQVAANEEGDLNDPEVYRNITFFQEVPLTQDEAQPTQTGADQDMGENMDVVEPHEEAMEVEVESDETEQAQPRKKGRPKKTSSGVTSEERRKPGRPRKQSGVQLASKSPRRTKSLGKSAFKDLRERRFGEDAAGEMHQVDNANDGDYQPESGEDIDDIIQEQPRGKPQVEKLRPSQVFPHDRRELKEFEKDSPRKNPGPALTARARAKSQTQTNAAQANTTRKRKRGDSDVADEERDANADNAANQRRLYGQWLPLQEIYKALDEIGCRTIQRDKQAQIDIELEDKDVKAVVRLCREARKRFTKLREESGATTNESDPATILHEISERVDGLRGRNDDYPTDFSNKRRGTSIYFHLVPKLVTLVRHAVICYIEIDKDEAPTDHIKPGHLRIIIDMITVITDLIKDAQRYYPRPDPDLHVVLPVKNKIGPPLRRVLAAFRRVLREHEEGIRETRRREDDARNEALRLEREEQQSRQQARINKLQKKWKRLHDVRSWNEGGIVRAKKLDHLQIASNLNVEYDQNGEEFSRTEAFRPRVGPTTDAVRQAGKLIWTDAEIRALHDGLKEYSGADVFERIFKEYCGAGRALNRFNVTEIVTAAVMMKDAIIAHLQGNGEDGEDEVVEDWVLAIPVWTKAQAPGRENDDSLIDLTA